ncbi:hypothetical protein [uncultured Desulfobacter sp.]|uniref:hypothetical protein n=1 Tax=uncultured Desulfobacter sp. TaxID=240139 RepID=UPI0029F56F77|nr:hypothetical protein [uncultured Desulfobacter sp.]
MSITAALQSGFASYSAVSKHTFYEKESSSQKKHGLTVDTVSLSAQVVSTDITNDSDSTTVEAVAKSVSVKKTIIYSIILFYKKVCVSDTDLSTFVVG